MEVWSFSPPDEEFEEFRSSSPASMPDHSMDFESRPQSAILPPTNLTLPPITASSLASVAATAAETDEEDGDVAMGEGDAA